MTFKISKTNKKILLRVARISLVNFLKNGKKTKFNYETEDFLKHRAVFVSLWERDSGALRGCIGHLKAIYPLVEAVSKTAISSAFEDSRFTPLTINELKNIKIEINALSSLTKILPSEIKVGKHGLYLIKGSYSGVFLPEVAVSQRWNKKKLLDELCLKAGLKKDDWKNPATKLLGFESESWFEN